MRNIQSIFISLLALSAAICPEFFRAKAAATASSSQPAVGEALKEVPFHKGVNVNAWFDRRASQVDMHKITGEDFDFIKSLGMDVVRLPVNFHLNMGAAPTYTLNEVYLQNLDKAVELITSRGLWVILDHHSLSVEEFPSDGEDIIREGCKQLALRYKGHDKVALELCNEPFFPDMKQTWGTMQGRIIKEVRACDPDLIIIATPWGCEYDRLKDLPEYNDPRVVYTFHYYRPMMFSHQGAYWCEYEQYLADIPFPHDASRMPEIPAEWAPLADRVTYYNTYPEYGTVEKIKEEIKVAADWAKQHGKLVFCGEFGALNTCASADRYRWLKAVADALAEDNIPWTLWQYNDQLLVNFSIFDGSQIYDQLDTELMEALGLPLPEKFAGAPRPLLFYSDSTDPWCQYRTSKNVSEKYLDYYCKDNPAEGANCIRYNVANTTGGVWFEIWLPANASRLQAAGGSLEFMARTTDKINSLEFYFQHYIDGEPRQWRMSATLSSNGNSNATRQLTPDGQWHKISIPLSELQYHGCDGQWKEHPDASEKGFDWSRINWLMITPAGDSSASGKTIYLDDIKITAQNDKKIHRQLALLCSDKIEINGTKPGWNPSKPYIVDRSDDGKFHFSVNFGNGTQTWQMYTDGILSGDEAACNASSLLPDFTAAFSAPLPEDLKIGNAFNSKYLAQAVGKTVPVTVAKGQGFQVAGNDRPLIYNIVMPADLSTMTIESITYPENLYLLGDATPGGWDNSAATPMENLGNGVYRYIGVLNAGSPGALQIYADKPSVCGVNAKAFGLTEKQTINWKGVSATNLNYYPTDRPGDCFYQVEDGQTNYYNLSVNVVESTISCIIDNLYFVGDPTGWKFNQMDKEGESMFIYKGHFNKNNAFCFTAYDGDKGWSTKIATSNDAGFGLAPFTDNTLLFGSQCAVRSNCEGNYIVSANLAEKTLSTRTYNPDPIEKLYVASKGAYSEMAVEQDGTFSWTGTLRDSFTITPGKEEYPCYIPAQGAVTLSADALKKGEMAFNTSAANNITDTWTPGEAGEYTVVVHPAAMTINISKNGQATILNGIEADNIPAPASYYNLMGRKVENPQKGIYIRVRGDKVEKVVIG